MKQLTPKEYAKPIAPSRAMPCNMETEKALLGGIFLDPACLSYIRVIVEPGAFYSEVNRRIYKAMLTLDNGPYPIDIVTVATQLQRDGWLEKIGGPSVLMEITEHVPTGAGTRYYASLVVDLATRRRVIQTAGRLIEDAHDHAGDIKDLIAVADRAITSLSLHDSVGLISSSVACSAFVREIEWLETHPGQLRGLATGFRDLDNILRGMRPDSLVILWAAQKMGKSTLAMNIAFNVAGTKDHTGRARRVLIFSVEMQPAEIVQREVARASGFPIDLFELPQNKKPKDFYQKMPQATARIAAMKIEYAPAWVRDISDIAAIARRMARETEGLDLIVVDHLTRVTCRTARTKEEEVQFICGELEHLAKVLNCVILAPVQANREHAARKDQRPQINDGKGSGAIEQTAHVLITLYRDEEYNPNTEDKGKAEVCVKANRFGKTGGCVLQESFATGCFKNLSHNEMTGRGGLRRVDLDDDSEVPF